MRYCYKENINIWYTIGLTKIYEIQLDFNVILEITIVVIISTTSIIFFLLMSIPMFLDYWKKYLYMWFCNEPKKTKQKKTTKHSNCKQKRG